MKASKIKIKKRFYRYIVYLFLFLFFVYICYQTYQTGQKRKREGFKEGAAKKKQGSDTDSSAPIQGKEDLYTSVNEALIALREVCPIDKDKCPVAKDCDKGDSDCKKDATTCVSNVSVCKSIFNTISIKEDK